MFTSINFREGIYILNSYQIEIKLLDEHKIIGIEKGKGVTVLKSIRGSYIAISNGKITIRYSERTLDSQVKLWLGE